MIRSHSTLAMKTITPKALSKGEAIGLISPSSHCPHPERITAAVEYLERCGYRAEPSRHLNRIAQDPAEADQEKLEDLHAMFADPSIRAIICLRGGAGASRLLGRIDYDLISRNPKILVGYSDITALSLAVYAMTGLVCFSGPMLATELYRPTSFTEEHFWGMLTEPAYALRLENHPEDRLRCISAGQAEGRLVGGNLSVLSSMIGTPYLPSLKSALLFVEDINEPSWRLDRMFAHLQNAGLLEQCHGLLLGQFDGSEPPEPAEMERRNRLFDYYCLHREESRPAVQGLSYGHIRNLLTMPVGARFRMEAQAGGSLSLGALEPVIHR